MKLPAQLKSKKVLLGLGAVVVILMGFFVLKFMSSGGTEAEPRKARPAPQTRKPISKPKKEEPEKSPLFEALKSWKDPFRGEDPEVVELQDKINSTKKEIEYLKASLEEKKLRQEIKELEKSISGTAATSTPRAETEIGATGGKKGKAESQKRVLVKAILITDDEKSALIVSGNRKSWVHEGEEFDGWEIKEIKKDSVVLLRAGKTYVFFYDRRHISKES
jgi:type IV pilus biogenesis protein PilP